MAKWYPNLKKKEKGQVFYSDLGKRFLTRLEMSSIKRDEARVNGQAKRGERVVHGTGRHSICQCGAEDCIIFLSWDWVKIEKENKENEKK